MRHQVEKGTFSYENKERTKREKLVRTKWAFHRFGALTVMDVAVFLFGVDLGFFGNGTSSERSRVVECLTWTPGATDPNDIAVGSEWK